MGFRLVVDRLVAIGYPEAIREFEYDHSFPVRSVVCHCASVCLYLCLSVTVCMWVTVAAAPPPFRPGNPVLCGSRPLVTPYHCRLGDLLCLYVYPLFVYYFVCVFCVFFVLWVVFLCSFLLQYFDIVGWVF